MSDDPGFYESLAAEYEDEARRHEDHERAISEALQDREDEEYERRVRQAAERYEESEPYSEVEVEVDHLGGVRLSGKVKR